MGAVDVPSSVRDEATAARALSPAEANGHKGEMQVIEAIKILRNENKIDLHQSPQDNAIAVLSSLLPMDLDKKVMASLVYALSVLKMDAVRMAVPAALSLDSTSGPINGDDALSDNVVLDWLVSSYTPKPRTAHKRKLSFKSLAKSIRTAIRLFGRRAPITNEVYLGEAADREAIKVPRRRAARRSPAPRTPRPATPTPPTAS
jgi:hypothetical protein